MDKDEFRKLASRLGLKTGAELEKIIGFKQSEIADDLEDDKLSSVLPCEKNQDENGTILNEIESNLIPNANEQVNKTEVESNNNSVTEVQANTNDKIDLPQQTNAIEQPDLPQQSAVTISKLQKKQNRLNAYFTLPENYANKYKNRVRPRPEIPVDKGLIACLHVLKRVDIEYIAALCDKSLKQVIIELGNKIFKNPQYDGDKFYEGYVHSHEYLSGNIVKKLNEAIKKSQTHPDIFDANIKALEAIVPPKPKFGDFYMGLGSPWIPANYIADFVQYLYRMTLMRDRRVCEVVYERVINRWFVVLNYDVKNSAIACKMYGTERMDMFKILEKTLNHEQIRITDAASGDKKGRALNQEQTLLAEEKRTMLNNSFRKWLDELDDCKKQELCDVWHERFSFYFVPYKFKTKKNYYSGEITLYDYQNKAVDRILHSKTTLLAHDVGAGKTYAMIISAHELNVKRAFKNLIVVPNSILLQWKHDYELLYPQAKILCVHPEDFSPNKREECLKKLAETDCESVLMAYSTFELIPVGFTWEHDFCDKKLAEIERKMHENEKRRTLVKNKINTLLNKKRSYYLSRKFELEKLIEQKTQINFDDLKFDSIFLDEAHNYKNLPLDSSLGNIKGINVDGSAKCKDVYLKTRTVLSRGGKLIFATGTPITNSVADAFVMQKYLQEDDLITADLDYFDNWAGVFGEITRAYEIDVDTENYRLTTRFNRFNNLNLLSKMLNRFTDFYVIGQDGLPKLESVNTVVVQKTQSQTELLREISQRVEKIRSGEVDRKTDNLLKVTTDGRKLALDPRLICGEENEECFGNKISECAKNVSKIFFDNPNKAQLVFCDIGTPKYDFNVYDELKYNLVCLGLPYESIGFVHDATSDKKREALFESVNNGAIGVLIGSTFKLGTGVNVQERLIALHHLDVPWRPSDMVQREGRLIRRGNTNEKVYIYRYVTEGSFDAYSWQLLENKQRFITELLTGTADDVNEQQLDDAVLSYAEVKALAIGNPLLKTRVELVNEIARYKMLAKDEERKNASLVEAVKTLPDKIEKQAERLSALQNDIKTLYKNYEIADKAYIAQLISFSASENENSLNETVICETNGFLIILPESFSRTHPYVILQGEGRYVLELATLGMGAVIKIENFFKNLKEQEQPAIEQLSKLQMQYRDACLVLQNKTDYASVIKQLSEQLKKVDEEIGI